MEPRRVKLILTNQLLIQLVNIIHNMDTIHDIIVYSISVLYSVVLFSGSSELIMQFIVFED